MKTVILNWYGPYTDDDLKQEKELGNGLYLITGKRMYQHGDSEIQYCGITEGKFCSRLSDTHHRKNEVTRNRNFWLSEVKYPLEVNRELLEFAEKIIVYFWQPELNDRKKISVPKETTVINRWFTKDREPRINQKEIYKNLDDVLSWDGKNWRTGNLKVYGNQ